MSGALECISPLYAFKSVTLRINLSLSYFDEMLSSNLLFPCSANLRATIPCNSMDWFSASINATFAQSINSHF